MLERMDGSGRAENDMPRLHRAEEPEEKGSGSPQMPVSAIVLAAVGGMLLFMGLFFLLIAGMSLSGFMVPAIVVIAIASLMMLSAWSIWRKSRERHEEMRSREKERLLCDYCGGMNAEGDLQCRFCGAPLR
ncbi:MAG: hypothetical protein GXY70_01010 [Euryarchaeota archaeon]|nr:hypothetical protein [Euryarchaeota archaeon]